MKTVKFIFAIHNHQPVGNFEFIYEEAYQNAYLPLIETVKEYPWFKINLHYTGHLLEWLTKAHPGFVRTLGEMAGSGQVEMMTGGFYEPILALLPDEDKIGQIRKLTGFIRDRLGREPKGMWLAERVWEPHLPRPIKEAGVDYVVVDDFHFKMSGLRERELTGYFLTDEQGSVLKVFPGSEKLRYTIPFKEPDETIRYLRELPDHGGHTLAVMADDGEKFGAWPGTHKWVYEDGWLRRFLLAFEQNRDWLVPVTFGEYVGEAGPRGRVYMPTCSYMEMGEWSLPTQAMKEYENFLEELKRDPDFETKRLFVKGGFFRSFLSKYSESNAMHKRMLQVSRKVHEALGAKAGKGAKAKALNEEMLNSLWQGQCNDAYWHGVFGGLYLPHLRDAVYRSLIKAEEAAERVINGAGGQEWLRVEEGDLDGDLQPEVMVSNRHMAVLADPAAGGCIREFDYRPIGMNLMNTLTRREEAYHEKIKEAGHETGTTGGATTIHERVTVKEKGLSDILFYDWYDRASLIDHFLGEADLDDFRRSGYHEAGDFVLRKYELKTSRTKDRVRLVMSRLGNVLGTPVRVEKAVTVRKDSAGFDVDYLLRNEGADELNTVFGVEYNFSLMAGDSFDRYYEVPGHVLKARNFAGAGELNNVREVRMVDEWLGYELHMTFGSEAVLWRFPVETVSQSESGFERVYQGSVVMPLWRLTLKPGEPWKVRIGLRASRRQ